MKWAWLFAVPALLWRVALAQDLTIVSEIADAAEKQAFLEAYRAKEAVDRAAKAQVFAARYPQSWLLAQAYDVWARASVELGAYSDAMEEAEFSLRLLPENPSLAVLIANVQATQGRYAKARDLAQRAVEQLEESDSALKPEIMASAYFVLGRSAVGEALRRKPLDRALTQQAREDLDRSVAWNPGDGEAFYLRGLAELMLGDQEARNDFAFAARSSSNVREQALQQLRRLKAEAGPFTKPRIDAEWRQPRARPVQAEAIRVGYAGSESCRSCHSKEFATWAQTGMANMLRPFDAGHLLTSFTGHATFKDEVRMGMDARPYFDVKDADGKWNRFHVDYTIGSKWQQAYATTAPDGAIHVLPIEYNALEKRWINYWETIDAPGNKRTVIAEFPKLSAATNYQENCAVCHTSQLRAKAMDAAPTAHATFREPGVNCEMCHGPSAFHAEQRRRGMGAAEDPLTPPVDFRRIGNREGVRICAQCHRQSAIRKLGAGQEMNYSTAATGYVPRFETQPFDAYLRRAFYKDGRLRQTTFLVEAFTRSACYRKGEAQCASCHEPHLPNFTENRTSLKFGADTNQLCLQCHGEYAGRIAQHSHHAEGSEGSRCVACHMPKIVNALEFQARSHQIEVPTADLTERFGQSESPNACLLCHQERSAIWVQEQLKRY